MYLNVKRDASSDAQAHLLRVLNGQGLPEAGQAHTGVDPATLAYTAQRREAVAQRFPSIPQMLGSRFNSLFAAYAAKESAPQGDVKRDMRGFVRHLRIKGRMPDRLTVTLLGEAMSAWPMRIARLREKRGVALAVRFPGMGVKVWSLSLPSRAAKGWK